jgi:ribosomal protein S12 methylthiotransferase accessory factor
MRLGTSLRTRAAAETWRQLQRLQPSLGISRVTDITRLDRLGLPVFASIRPRGWTLRVHAGKGLDADEARIGALMEALETELAELDAWQEPDAVRSLAELQSQWPGGLRPEHFAPDQGASLSAAERWPAVACECLVTGQRARPGVLLPDALVRLPKPGRIGPRGFSWSSNGLASGNTLDEATLHALLELLERDTLALHSVRDESRRLWPLPAPFEAWATRWQAEGVELYVRELPNEFGLACFEAHLAEPNSADVNLASGSGLHLDRGIALARAVSEAAQSRLSTLHGGRDDITDFYGKYETPDTASRLETEARLRAQWADRSRTVAFEAVPHQKSPSPSAALATLRRQMAERGFPWIFRHRLRWPRGLRPGDTAEVVKLVVPGCEMLERHNRRVGPRLLMRLAGHA